MYFIDKEFIMIRLILFVLLVLFVMVVVSSLFYVVFLVFIWLIDLVINSYEKVIVLWLENKDS